MAVAQLGRDNFEEFYIIVHAISVECIYKKSPPSYMYEPPFNPSNSTFLSGGTSNRKLELSITGASDPSAWVQKLIARKLHADDILIATHASDA